MLNHVLIEAAVRAALVEDLGRAGDITSYATIPAHATAEATIVARQAGVVSGQEFARMAFIMVDPALTFEMLVSDGGTVQPATKVARIVGPARGLLSAERVALNYLGRLSGIATLTAKFAGAIGHTKAKIADTRKTTPGLRAFEKYAVRCGGGMNHRFGLDDAILIKDNHIAVAGGVAPALRAAKASVGHLVKIEIEVDNLRQLREVIAEGADVVLLDNMSLAQLREAVGMVAGCMLHAVRGVGKCFAVYRQGYCRNRRGYNFQRGTYPLSLSAGFGFGCRYWSFLIVLSSTALLRRLLSIY